MATRRERVVLDLEDNLTPGLARAAVASQILDKSLNDLGKSSASSSTSLDKTSTSTKRVGDSSNKAGPAIDKFSGRLKAMRDVAILLGPALVPLGAATIPVLTGALVGLGAASAGIGVTVAAFNGIGDGLKALDELQLERTPENLAKVREEFDKIGPSGETFVRYLDSIEGELKDLQNTARAGVLPGAEAGIRSLLQLLPELRSLTADVSGTVGDLLSDAGGSLAGDDFTNFFDYIRMDAAPTLDAFARTTGNFALALGNLLAGLAPATRDATGGLLSFSERVREASANLDDNEGFRDFLDYVRTEGPEVAALLSATAGALASVAGAAAPYGAVVVPALTAVANALKVIADSPAGPTIVTTAAALTLLNRGMATFGKVSERPWIASIRNAETLTGKLNAARGPAIRGGLALAGLGLAASGAADKIGLGNTATLALTGSLAGPWGAAVGGAIGLFLDMSSSAEEYTVNSNEVIATLDQQTGAITQNTAEWVRNKLFTDGILETSAGLGLNLATVTQAALGNADAIAAVNKQLDALDAALFDSDGYEVNRENTEKVRSGAEQVRAAIGAVGTAIGDAQSDLPLLNAALDDTGEAAEGAADRVSHFDRALNQLNNTLDRRQAMRDYRDAIVDFNKALKDPETKPRELASALDGIARAGGQVAEKLSGADKLHFLSRVRAEYGDAAAKLIDSDKRVRKLVESVFALDDASAEPKVDIDLTALRNGIAAANEWLNGIQDETVNIDVIRRNRGGGSVDPTTGGDTSTPTKPPKPSRVAAPRVSGRGDTSSINGSKATAYLGLLKGTTDASPGEAWSNLNAGASQAGESLRRLKQQLDRAEKSVEKERKQRDGLLARRADVRSSIASDLTGNLFDTSGDAFSADASMDPMAAIAARKERAQRWLAAIATLKRSGLGVGALQAVIAEGLEATEYLAGQGKSYISSFGSALGEANQYVTQAQNAGAEAVVSNAELRAANRQLHQQTQALHHIQHLLEQAEKNKPKHDKNHAENVGLAFASHLDGSTRQAKVRSLT